MLKHLNFDLLICFVRSSIIENEDRKASPYSERQFQTLHLSYQLTVALKVVVIKMEVADVLLPV